MAVSLPIPTRSMARTPARRVAVTPQAIDVTQKRPESDPGVNVPAGAFGGAGEALTEVGKGLEQASDQMFVVAERQQKRFDATKTAEAEIKFKNWAAEELRRRSVEGDPTSPTFMKDHGTTLGITSDPEGNVNLSGGYADEVLKSLPAGVSKSARERLRITLLGAGSDSRNSAGKMHIDAAQKASVSAITELAKQAASQARQDPTNVEKILKQLELATAQFDKTLEPDAEKKVRLANKAVVVYGAIDAYAEAGMEKEAKALAAKYAGEFTVTQNAYLKRNIEAIGRDKQSAADRADARLYRKEGRDARAEAKRRRELADAQEIASSNAMTAILKSDPAATYRSIEDLFEANKISGNQRANLVKLKRSIDTGGAKISDPATYVALNRMSPEDRDKVNLLDDKYLKNLSPTHLQKFSDMKRTYREMNPVSTQGMRTRTQIINDVTKGWNHDRVVALDERLDEEVAALKASKPKGYRPENIEIKRLVDRLLIDGEIKGTKWQIHDPNRKLFEVKAGEVFFVDSFSGIKDQKFIDAARARYGKGAPKQLGPEGITDDQILARYNRHIGGKAPSKRVRP